MSNPVNSQNPVQHPLPFSTPSERHSNPNPRPLSNSSTVTSATIPRSRQPVLSVTPFSNPTSPTSQSTTHAGGIQPSASFFHPVRPLQFSRPSSADSSAPSNNISPILAPDGDVFQLAPLTKAHSNASSEDALVTIDPASTAEDEDVSRKNSTTLPRPIDRQHSTTVKHSREPLLPIGGRIPTRSTSTRAPIPRAISQNTSTPAGASRRFRNSLEKVFNRALSFDSNRRSVTTRPRPTAADDLPPEGKISDEERGVFRTVSTRGTFPTSMSPTAASPTHPSFVPHPPTQSTTPLSAVPVLKPSGKPVRKYQRHPSRNKFFFGGRLLTGGDSPWAFLGSVLLVLAIGGTWFATTCVWWWGNLSPGVAAAGAYMFLVVISSMLATAMCDPGILPRNLDPNPPFPSTSPSDGGIRAPMPRDLKVRRDIIRVKYCPTCRTYRPPRSSHCKMCDNCVDGCDHHCQWVNNCVGRRNYTSFFVFLTSATLTLILVIVTAALHLYFLAQRENVSFREALNEGIGSAVVFCLAIAVVWPVAALLGYHLRLLLLNITTIEQIRNQAHKSLVSGPTPPNPFSHGSWRRNLVAVLCRPVGYSWLDGEGIVTDDKREINPGVRWDEGDNKQ